MVAADSRLVKADNFVKYVVLGINDFFVGGSLRNRVQDRQNILQKFEDLVGNAPVSCDKHLGDARLSIKGDGGDMIRTRVKGTNVRKRVAEMVAKPPVMKPWFVRYYLCLSTVTSDLPESFEEEDRTVEAVEELREHFLRTYSMGSLG